MVRLETGELTLIGRSVAGFGTSVLVKELGFLLDVGVFEQELLKGEHLFLSHAHPDHCGALISWLGARRLLGMRTANIFAPQGMADGLQELLRAWEKIQGVTFDYRVFGVGPGAELALKDNLHVRAVPLEHRIETLGYLFERRIRKLKPQFVGLPGHEIRRRKAEPSGDEMFTLESRPLLAWLPDTLPEALDRLPDLAWRSRVFMVECTFLDDRKDIEKIRKGAHTRLDDILERLDRFSGEILVPFHFSRMYRTSEVHALLDARIPADKRSLFKPFI